MTAFSVTRHTTYSVDQAWAAVSDFATHGDVVPGTRMRLDPGTPRLGWRFSAGTGAGPVTIWDHMVVTAWQPPAGPGAGGHFAIVKLGPWLRGWARVEIEPEGDGARVVWTEELGPRLDPVPALTAGLSARAGRWLFARTLDGLLAGAPPAADPGTQHRQFHPSAPGEG